MTVFVLVFAVNLDTWVPLAFHNEQSNLMEISGSLMLINLVCHLRYLLS